MTTMLLVETRAGLWLPSLLLAMMVVMMMKRVRRWLDRRHGPHRRLSHRRLSHRRLLLRPRPARRQCNHRPRRSWMTWALTWMRRWACLLMRQKRNWRDVVELVLLFCARECECVWNVIGV
eukprot:Rmarinus@m.28129